MAQQLGMGEVGEKQKRSRLGATASFVDTAILVFVVLVVGLVLFKVLLGFAGLIWLVVRMAALAVVIALGIRAYFALKRRSADKAA